MKFPLALALLALLAGTGVPAIAGDYAEQKVVYHNDGSTDPDYFKHLLGNIRNHLDAVGDDNIELVVVANGDGLELLQQATTDGDLAERIDALRGRGVRFLVCANTLRGRDIGVEDLHGVSQADVVPSGVAEIAKLEQQGFVYLHP